MRVVSGSSSSLAQQIVNGAPADLYLSASIPWGQTVATARPESQMQPLVTNRLVLAVPKGNPASVQDIADLVAKHVQQVAVGGRHVPCGVYARQVLEAFDVLHALDESHRLAIGSDARTTMFYVESAEVDAGLLYASDALMTSEIEVVLTISNDHHDVITYPLMLVDGKNANAAAANFFRFLQSDPAMAAFSRHGFLDARVPQESDTAAPPR